jgi:preprotein translocase subunit SecD
MLDFPRWRIWMLNLVILAGILFALPTVLPANIRAQVAPYLSLPSINLGLDLAGGSHILLEADMAQLEETRLESLEDGVRAAMRRAEPRIAITDVSRTGGQLAFTVTDSSQVDAAREVLLPLIGNATGGRDWNIGVNDGNRVILTPAGAGTESAMDQAMDTAKDVIGRRIDALGTLEPDIRRQGDDRISVAVPGLDDPEALKALIGKTAKLEFKLVDEQADPDQTAKGVARVGSQVLPYPDNPTGLPNIAVRRLGGIAGDKLVKADPTFDQQTNEPAVTIQFDTEGGQKFARMTQQNTGKLFAIILDGQVISAPQIREPIFGGISQISGSFTVESANQLAIALRSGALPVDLKIVEERSVGPDLGADSIRRGAIACLIALAVVMAYMVVTYGSFGWLANIAVALNIIFIVAIMSLFGFTLTLPGLAGMVLTIGAAVDANVLINERIREELRRGRSVLSAIEHGFDEASTAIFDANATNVIAGVLMYTFGSGPIAGFAVVLMIGILTSYFSAVTLTRMWVSLWVKRTRPRELVL